MPSNIREFLQLQSALETATGDLKRRVQHFEQAMTAKEFTTAFFDKLSEPATNKSSLKAVIDRWHKLREVISPGNGDLIHPMMRPIAAKNHLIIESWKKAYDKILEQREFLDEFKIECEAAIQNLSEKEKTADERAKSNPKLSKEELVHYYDFKKQMVGAVAKLRERSAAIEGLFADAERLRELEASLKLAQEPVKSTGVYRYWMSKHTEPQQLNSDDLADEKKIAAANAATPDVEPTNKVTYEAIPAMAAGASASTDNRVQVHVKTQYGSRIEQYTQPDASGRHFMMSYQVNPAYYGSPEKQAQARLEDVVNYLINCNKLMPNQKLACKDLGHYLVMRTLGIDKSQIMLATNLVGPSAFVIENTPILTAVLKLAEAKKSTLAPLVAHLKESMFNFFKSNETPFMPLGAKMWSTLQSDTEAVNQSLQAANKPKAKDTSKSKSTSSTSSTSTSSPVQVVPVADQVALDQDDDLDRDDDLDQDDDSDVPAPRT